MDDDEKSLILDDKSHLRWLPKSPEMYLDKTTIIYGAPNTGKTTLVDEVLFQLREKIPLAFVVAPTNTSNNAYTGRVPSKCIIPRLTPKWLSYFLSRQKDLSEVYQRCHNLELLEPMFMKIATPQLQKRAQVIKDCAKQTLAMISSRINWQFAKQRTQKGEVERMRDVMLRNLYRRALEKSKDEFKRRQGCTVEELTILDNMNCNPNAMLIFDDCASFFKEWYKQTGDMFREIFYTNRWLHLTVVITTQDDKEISTEMRKTAMLLMFTNAQMAAANFDRTSNYYTKQEKARASLCIKAVFDQPKNEPLHHRKLVYIRGTSEFRYTIADIYDNFKFGDPKLWGINRTLCDRHKKPIEHNMFFRTSTT